MILMDKSAAEATGGETAIGGTGGRSGARMPRDRRRPSPGLLAPGLSTPEHSTSAARIPAMSGDAGAAWVQSLLEAGAIVAASVMSGLAYSLGLRHQTGDMVTFLANGLLVAALFCTAMRAREAQAGTRPASDSQALRSLFTLWCIVFSFVGFLCFFLKLDPAFPRGALVAFFVLGFVAVGTIRTRTPELIAAHYHPRRHLGRHVVLVGARGTDTIEALSREFRFTGCHHISPVAIDADCTAENWPQALEDGIGQIRSHARRSRNGQIYVAAEGFAPDRLSALLHRLQRFPHAIGLVPAAAIETWLRLPARPVGRRRAIEIQRAPLNPVQRAVKRAIDLCIAVPLLMLAAPTMAAIALWVKADSKGPVLFRQDRLGYRGRPFTIYKFRTMHVLENGARIDQARRGDGRITRAGRALRRMSLDELPQLFNVIKGEMALVGPRPHAVAHDHLFAGLIGNYELRQHVKPGITGWAQIHGLRGETATVAMMRQRVEFDLWYVKNASLGLDLHILARTLCEVLRQRNAF
jgi:Undecaprenyl-phosphate glucose phosphotransferase